MAAPRSSTAFTGTTGATPPRKPPAVPAKPVPARKAVARSGSKPEAENPAISLTTEMLHDLRINGDALSAQIARLADRFL